MISGSVTIIVLLFNDEDTGPRAIESALTQTYPNLKVKILDNGSRDNTAKLIQRYSSDPRVEIVTNPVNQRSEFAVRESLKVDTEYLSFLFSDDYYAPNRIESLVAKFAASDIDAVFSNCSFRHEDGRPIAKVPLTQFSGNIALLDQNQHLEYFIRYGNSLHPCAMLIKTSAYKELGGFCPYLHRIGDMAFFARLLVHKKVCFTELSLQTITIWRSGRNESYSNAYEYRPIIIERGRLLDSYRSIEFLKKVEHVFGELRPYISENTSISERLFWTGKVIHTISGDDFLLFGTRCMMDAYDQDPVEIDTLCQKHFQQSFSAYLYSLSATPVPVEMTKLLIYKIRRKAKTYPALWRRLRVLKLKVSRLKSRRPR